MEIDREVRAGERIKVGFFLNSDLRFADQESQQLQHGVLRSFSLELQSVHLDTSFPLRKESLRSSRSDKRKAKLAGVEPATRSSQRRMP